MSTMTTLRPAPTSAVNLAQKAETPKTGAALEVAYPADRFAGEPKLDGWRLLAHRDEDSVHLYTRTAKSHDGSLPAIEAEIMERFPAGTWLDCEAIAMKVENGAITHDWAAVQSCLGSGTAKAAAQSDGISLMIFDLIAHGGNDARQLPYDRRRALLERIFEGETFERLLLVPQLKPTTESLDALLAQGFEGMMIKKRSAPYASGKKGAGWTKIKPSDNMDCVIMGFKPGESGFTGLVGAVIFGQYDADGKLQERGRCSGMDMKTRLAMTKNWGDWDGTVIEVGYLEIMPSGKLRSPQMKRRRPDKPATDCTWTVAS